MTEALRPSAGPSPGPPHPPRHGPDERPCALKHSPLSPAQHQVWLSEQLGAGGTAYHIADVYSLGGPLRPRVLEQALNELVRRHAALRTTFTVADDEAVQVIHPALPLELPVVDLSRLAEAEREAAADSRLREEAARPFDLTAGPLLRATLLRLGAHNHLLSLVAHHLVCDGWSFGVLLRELGRLYAAFVSGAHDPLPELPWQYADYAAWQRERLRGEEFESHLGYWRRRLEGVPALLDLPTDRPRPAARSARGGRLMVTLPERLTVGLRELSRGAGATLFMTLLAGFKVLLARQTGREDVVVGTPVAGRHRSEVEGLVGLFANTLVLRTDLSGGPSFLELLRRVRDVFLDAYEHQEVPVEMLVGELQIERSLSHTPLVQVLFNMLSYSARGLELPEVAVRRLSPPETDSKFDLTLYAQDHPAGLTLTLVYSADLFAEARMRELLEQFTHLLEQVVADPRTAVTQYSLVTDSARKILPDPCQPLELGWSGAAHTLLSRRAGTHPGRVAVADARSTWTYQELDARSDQLARRLLAAGIQRGELVAVYAHRSAPLVCAMYAILKAGAAFLLLDPAYPARRLVEYLRVARPAGLLRVAAAGGPPPEVEEFLAGVDLRCRLTLDADAVAEEHADVPVSYSTGAPSVAARPGDLAYVAFTSGSTGRPKGVMGTHGSLTHYHEWVQETFGVGGEDRFSMLSGLSHDPLLRDIFTPLLLGASLHIPDPELSGRPGRLARWMRGAGITVTNLTPATGQMLNEFPGEDERTELAGLRHAFFVGDKLTRLDVSRFRRLAPSASCVNLYGATETQRSLGYYVVPALPDVGGAAAGGRPGGEVIPVGRGITGVQVLVLNSQQRLAGVGESGEVYLRSPRLAEGYLDDPALTRERFVRNPFADSSDDRLYRTGDLGRYLPDGSVELLGRADRQVKIRGFRVEPGEVEATLRAHPGVRECAVVPREDSAGERRLVAYLVTRGGPEARGGELRARLLKTLPDYMVPSYFVFMEALPVTPNGKVDGDALPPPGETPARAHGGYEAPRTPVGEALAGIWRQALNLTEVGAGDNFFESGGHSLLVMRVLSRVREALQVELPPRSLFEAPTLDQFTARVEAAMRDASGASAAPVPRRPPTAEPPLSFSQEGLLVREWWEEVNGLPKRPSQLASALRLTGPLDLGLLERTINEVVRRHDILRATFPQTGGLLTRKSLRRVFKTVFGMRAVQSMLPKLDSRGGSGPAAPRFTGGRKQVIRPHVSVPLTIHDLRDVCGGEREAEITRILTDGGAAPFDYDNGPLLRVAVVRSADEEHVVSFVLHHLVCDAWSLRVLVGEVLTLYRALAEGQPSPLPELPIQYADFARWQRGWFRGETLRAAVSYWEGQFSGVGLFPELALPFVRAARRGTDGRRHVEARSETIPAPLSNSLRQLGYARGATTYMLFMAALNALLHRYTGAAKISIYTPFANRSRAETQGAIGWFSNVHVLSVDCSGNPAFAELLGRVREAVLGAYAHQEVPYLQVVKTLLREGKGYSMPSSVSEIPYVFFDCAAQARNSQQVGPLDVSHFPLPPSSAAAGLAGLEVRALEQADRTVVTVRYSPEAVEAAHVGRMLSELRQLLHGVAQSPEERILNLPLA